MEPRPSPSGRTCVVSRKRRRGRTISTNGDQSSGIGGTFRGGSISPDYKAADGAGKVRSWGGRGAGGSPAPRNEDAAGERLLLDPLQHDQRVPAPCRGRELGGPLHARLGVTDLALVVAQFV